MTPSRTNCLAILPPQAFLFLSCGLLRAKHTTMLVITERKGDPPQFSLTLPRGGALLWPPKGPQGSSCNSNQSLKSCNLGLAAWVVACEEDINQVAPNKNEGEEGGRVLRTVCEKSLALSVLLSSEESLPTLPAR